ncbi:limonene-1,2-epoxide hydrolase family protein [Phenylobacterium kunshanense]|uniref:Limonene-1,2-epoxide hydrolase n=1 Tax=Phenylobacterium kunshanense TaxID=1445034 RepID=A0A328B5W4_9CAUL|nr:limonene-1,2-epoxide hydrolase family protein [Phenylobacterium kunshanense]RAK62760.1 limonene-1,2-epoxide hydrolase [Phenylobacterium kunshanense]
MSENARIIRDFIAAWSRLDAAELAAFFAEDGVYHNMPARPVAGRAAVQAFIAGFIKDWTATEWDVLNIVEAGDVVIAERLDRTRVGDKPVDLPCCGVFEMSGGKIKVWRDYFDLATYTRALGA